MIEVKCNHCGSINSGFIVKARPPHAYRVDCVDCGRFYKWASKYEVEGNTLDNVEELKLKIQQAEGDAIKAARLGDGLEVWKQLKIRDKYAERL